MADSYWTTATTSSIFPLMSTQYLQHDYSNLQAAQQARIQNMNFLNGATSFHNIGPFSILPPQFEKIPYEITWLKQRVNDVLWKGDSKT